jgi:hypothetical protein
VYWLPSSRVGRQLHDDDLVPFGAENGERSG